MLLLLLLLFPLDLPPEALETERGLLLAVAVVLVVVDLMFGWCWSCVVEEEEGEEACCFKAFLLDLLVVVVVVVITLGSPAAACGICALEGDAFFVLRVVVLGISFIVDARTAASMVA